MGEPGTVQHKVYVANWRGPGEEGTQILAHRVSLGHSYFSESLRGKSGGDKKILIDYMACIGTIC
jgi:hypothetical protein